ncbi:hypothetical protein IJX73_01940 [bacterium]|nr:hypothetical protein [bacterium]MBQ9149670.1 hypothetical protein [bacterium]
MALKALETISDHSTSFAAGVSFASALILRPLAISLTPKTDKENKKILTSESVSSAIAKFAMVEMVALPIERAVKNIDKKPDEFLKSSTIKNLKASAKKLSDSREYKFATQIIKTGANLLSSIPKSIIGVALIPLVNDFLFSRKNDKKNQKIDSMLNKSHLQENSLYAKFNSPPFFTGLSKFVAKAIDSDMMQKIAKNHVKNDKDIARNMSSITDVILTLGSVVGVKTSKKIDENKKNTLISNKLLSSAISIFAGCSIDNLVQKGTKKTIDGFREIQKNNPKLLKYIEGINILRPTMIFAFVYYGLMPMVTTFVSDKITENKLNTKK